MEYFVQRGDQKFGPYTLSDLQNYVQSGNIALNDLAKSEGMVDWIPVSQVLGDIPAAVTVPIGAGAMSAVEQSALVPLPPNLHWGWLLAASIISTSLAQISPTFALAAYLNIIWSIVEANWARRLSNSYKPLILILIGWGGFLGSGMIKPLAVLLVLIGAVSLIWGMFSIRAAMEEYYNSTENIGLSLSGAMTFFFNVIYFQFHINRIAHWKKTGAFEDAGAASSVPSITRVIDYHKETHLVRDSNTEAK